MTPAATGAAVAAVGLLLQVVERVYHVLQTVHVVPAKRTNSFLHLNVDLGFVFERLPVDVPVPQVPVGLVLDVPDGVGHDGAGDWALAWIFSLDGDPLFHHGDLELAEDLKGRRRSMFDVGGHIRMGIHLRHH